MNNADKVYLDLLKEVRENGIKKSDRTGTGTISLFGRSLTFNMQEGFPLLTTKKIHTKSVIHELLWFLDGSHNIKYLVDNGVNIWNEWPWQNYMKEHEKLNKMLEVAIKNADHGVDEHAELVNKIKTDLEAHPALTIEEFVAKIKESSYEPLVFLPNWNNREPSFAEKWGELGPVYGKQWRRWQGWMSYDNGTKKASMWFDQILRLVQQLKTNPDSRRLMVSAWNVAEIEEMLLPPCHYAFQCWTRELEFNERLNFIKDSSYDKMIVAYCESPGDSDLKNILESVLEKENTPKRALSLMWQQRSVDLFLGLPFNIASYGLLLEMLAQSTNMVADQLIFNGGDCHIYSNHVEQVDLQLSREPMPLCKVKLNKPDSEYSSLHGNNGHIIEYKYEDFAFENYQSHPAIKAPIAI